MLVSIVAISLFGYCDFISGGAKEKSGILKTEKDYTLWYLSDDIKYSYPVYDFATLEKANEEAYEVSFVYEERDERLNISGWYYPIEKGISDDTRKVWHMEPPGYVEKKGEIRCVPESLLEKYRYDGWNIKEFSGGLYSLGEEIKEYIKGKKGSFGVYVKNLKTGQTLILNDKQYASASIIKMFVMAGIYNELYKGNIEKTPAVEKFLHSMITVSDNYASNYLVGVMGHKNYKEGFARENEHSHSVGCINTNHKSLFIGYGDYVTYGTNTVSPLDCGIMLEKIYNKTLISEEYSEEMLSLLKKQTRRYKLPYYLPKDVLCANKTGETSTVQSDVGIVFSPNCDYIICVITNKAPNGIENVRKISKITYDYFNK